MTDAQFDVLLAELRGIRAAIERDQAREDEDDPRDGQILAALADALGDLDLAFDVREVLEHAAVHHGLGEALAALGVTTPEQIGLLFRRLRGRFRQGYRLIRDGRLWRLEREPSAHAARRRAGPP